MVSLSRFSQIKELQSQYDRWYIENAVLDLNIETVEKNSHILQALERYVSDFITSDDFSLDYIHSLLTKLKVYKWLGFQTETGLAKMLFNLIFNTVLLPNYLTHSSAEKNYKELKEIIDNYLRVFDQQIEQINIKNYALEIWYPYEIVKEIKRNNDVGENILNFRLFHIWEWFWNNVFELDDDTEKYTFRIPIDLASKANKTKRKLNKEKLRKFIEEKTDEITTLKKLPAFIIDFKEEYDTDTIYWNDDKIPYFTISITKDTDDIYNTNEVITFLKTLLEINNFLINEIATEFWIKIPKQIYLFSSWESLVVSRSAQSKTESKFEQLKVKDEQKASLKDVWWQEEAKKQIETIIKMLKYEHITESWWAKHTKGIIFEWPTWTGKTLLAKVIAHEINAEVYNIKLTDIQSSALINEWPNNIKELFSFLRKRSAEINKKIIVILDELDALFKKRNGSINSSWEDTKIVNTFLSEMNWFEDLEDVIFVGTTNLIETIDEAVIRSGRMSTKIKVGLPDSKALKQIYEIHIWKLPQKAKNAFWNIEIDILVKKSDGLSGADIQEIINRIIIKKALQEIETKEIADITQEECFEIINQVRGAWEKKSIWFISNV